MGRSKQQAGKAGPVCSVGVNNARKIAARTQSADMYFTEKAVLARCCLKLPCNPILQKKAHSQSKRYHNTKTTATISHLLVKHTANILRAALSISVRMSVMMMQLRPSHATKSRFAHAARTPAWTHAGRRRHPWRAARACHMGMLGRILDGLPVVNLGHSPNTSATQSRILIAISPAVNGSLDQTSLSS